MRYILFIIGMVLLCNPANAANIAKLSVDYGSGNYLRTPPNYVLSRALSASTAESFTVPTDQNGQKAEHVIFSANCDFYVNTVTTATVPGDVTDGSASVLNPTGYYLKGQVTTISVISAGTCIVTAEFWAR